MEFKPFIPADQRIPEVTFQSISLGVLLGILLSAANAYLGLYAGMTVSASIPAAVISMAVLRGILKRGTILENNIVQTIASSGESLAAGIIFTVPAMVLTGVWTEIRFWPTAIICITGGMLGVLFMIPLRKSHIVEDKSLRFPEGLACAEVLKAGERGGSGAKALLGAIGFGAIFKFLTSGYSLFKGTVEGAWAVGKTGFFFGADISPALLGVGYIVGRNVALVVFMGSTIAWLIALPLLGVNSIQGDVMEWFWSQWSSQIRFMGVGAMVVGGIWSIFSIRSAITQGVKEAIDGYRHVSERPVLLRTEQSIPTSQIGVMLLLTITAVFFLYHYLTGAWLVALASTISMTVMSFLFVAVASYIVGLVGSSNSPVSGMTICAVLATGTFLSLFGYTGQEGMMATLGVAGVVCCAVCSAGDISQDLKTGYLLGSTPKLQQWMEVVGVLIPAIFVAPVLVVLHHSYGIGTGLKAPQATLFASIARGLFGEGAIPWNMVIIGAVIGIAIIITDQILKKRGSEFRMPIMAAAIGIYLPLTLNVPILIGGLLSGLAKDRSDASKGVLFASGLIAGESIMGVAIALLIYFFPSEFPKTMVSSDVLSIAAFAMVAYFLLRSDRK